MWLLNSHSLELEHFEDETQKYGRYAILSHVWLAKDVEVSFQDLRPGGKVAYDKAGWAKIEQTCRRARADKLDHCWIDTCCIDKTSSAELSEAINSMYRWYYQAKVCYAYLADVPEVSLCDSIWFTRGWTLQELIAPGYIEFYNKDWELMGSKISMLKELAEITRICDEVLRDREALQSISVAARMAWASDRSTTRIEDRAYSLMGIFDVNLPMLYGEGEKAFARLQEEIIRTSTDHSIIVWQAWQESHLAMLMSPSPYGFRRAHNIVSWSNPIDEAFQLANKGLRISLPAVRTAKNPELLTAILNCRYSDNTGAQIAVILRELPHQRTIPAREVTSTVCELTALKTETGGLSTLRNLERRHLPSATWQKLLILKEKPRQQREDPGSAWTQKIKISNTVSQLRLMEVWPPEAYDSREGSVTFVSEHERGYMIFGERDGKKKFISLAFGQELKSGRAEPRICLARYASLPDVASVFRSLESSRRVKIEFKKGLSELLAEVEKRLDSNGDLEWSISLRLEHYSDHLRSHLKQLVHRS
ncbi:uncharacterized protein RCC_07203 [Ramularia collo-cygni]|uniref:Heterokaryon incompatibility domain-containing protein n=1 Tax=Ramularia collo-cygni TaxID=112498 RepID=A0A2D3V7B8_9PEZI|nr:uncharacterized protein RCC_07203 [Ramularia collo-cygni]CZT21340.1 uncharacterized protein RCC_07203 [Ramularia collo-cygni]